MEEERKAANFIEAEINKDIENHVYANDRGADAFSAGTEWIPSHRACEIHMPEFFPRQKNTTANAI